ncbi:MAG: SLC13 family permease, partial [Anaerolineales bacterium]
MRRAYADVLPFLLAFIAILLWLLPAQSSGAMQKASALLAGRVIDSQDQPIFGAEAALEDPSTGEVLSAVETQENGRFAIDLTDAELTGGLELTIERPHFETISTPLSNQQVERLEAGEAVALPTFTLARELTPAFWIATAIFLGMLAIIASGFLHNTLAALLGASVIFAFSYLGELINPGLFIFNFEDSLRYVDWNVIFLVMGMMIVIAVIEGTGIFQWLAFFAYRISGGKMYLLLPILMLITGIASAFLDNVTTMLLMTPISVQIALALNVNPMALLMSEVFASNVIGVSTLVGTPTNILIGSFGNISFNDFLVNLTPGVL